MVNVRLVVASAVTDLGADLEQVELQVIPVEPPQPNIPVVLWADATAVIREAFAQETEEGFAELDAEWSLAWAKALLDRRWEGQAVFHLLTPEQLREEVARKEGRYEPNARTRKRFEFLAKKSKELVDQILADLYSR